MFNSRTENLRLLKTFGAFVVITLILIFVIFRSLDYLKGPEIEIYNPENGSSVETNIIKINGNAKRIIKITLNGYPISINEQGDWEETLTIYPGLNLITVSVEDRFGRTKSKQLDIVGKTNQ